MDTIKIEQRGKNQIINIPNKYNFEENEVYIKKVGNSLVIMPKKNPWNGMFESLNMFTDDFMADRIQPGLDKRDNIR